jgi:hypothetical protein
VFTSFERAFDLHERLVSSEETHTLDQFFCARDSLLIPLKGSNAGMIVESYRSLLSDRSLSAGVDGPLRASSRRQR